MPGPGGDQAVVGFNGLLHGFIAGGVVGIGIEFLRAFGGGDQVEDGVVMVPELHLGGAQLTEDVPEFPFRHIGAVVEGAAVADHKHLVRLKGFRDIGEGFFLGEHEPGNTVLVFLIVAGQLPGRAAAAELGGGLIHEQDQVALFGKGVLDPAHGGGLARTGPAGDHNPGDGLFPGSVCHFRSLRPVSGRRAGRKTCPEACHG